jgi:hypothetical protein
MRTLVTHYVRSTLQQSEFRRTLLKVYNSTCPVTQCHIPSVIEACHLIPFSESGTFKSSNGILLRADLNRLLEKNFFGSTKHILYISLLKCVTTIVFHGLNFESIFQRILNFDLYHCLHLTGCPKELKFNL